MRRYEKSGNRTGPAGPGAVDAKPRDDGGFTSLDHARVEIERWRREYNEERPKKSLGGLTPAQYAKQLAIKAVTIPENSSALRY